jgi:hypothetical protein
MQFSTDAQTAAIGGDAGCHLPSEFPSTVAPIVQATAVGQVADPIPNNAGGFVIIKVSDRKPAVFTDVAAQAEELAARDQSVQFNAWLSTAQGSADVSVDPRYGTFDPATFTIKPPPIDSNAPSSGSNTVPTSAPPAVSSTASTTPP